MLFAAFFLKAQTRTTISLAAGDFTVTSYTDKEVILNNKTNLHITSNFAKSSLVNSIISLNSVDSWVYFDNVRPQTVIDSLLKYISVNGQAAILRTNTRVSIYKHGTVVIPQASTFQPFKVYSDQNFSGDSTSYSLFAFNNSLGGFDNKIRSFKLKRGYMATLATSADGLGYSRVFIAADADLLVPVMPDMLDKKVSFVRVFSWEYVSKKGWCGSDFNEYTKTKSTWRYDWSAGGTTTSYVEYVPIKQNLGWPGWSEISNKQYITHALGYNEPDHTEQSNVTVVQAIAEWPNMLKTGLRVGSPAVTNNAWLYQFMDSCKARNYRVDYVAYHAYWGGKSPQNWYNDLKAIYLRTGRPIWITEWNNGANWTTETWPTADKSLSAANAAKQLNDIKAILNVLDTASFIERYSIYNWVQDCRAMVLNGVLTPAGEYYAADKAPMAFNKKYEVIPSFKLGNPTLSISFGTNNLTLTETDPNAENFEGMVIEKNVDDQGYTEFYNSTNISRNTTDVFDLNAGTKFRYKVKARLPNDVFTAYSPETGYDITNDSEIQCGKLSYYNVGWNGVFFKKPFATIPTIILGAPTNNNSSVLMSPRVKLINISSRFNVQLAPWSYQKVSTLTKEDTTPYLALNPGNYDFGGLKAIAGKNSANGTSWTAVTFSVPFDTIPVVFTTQLLSSTTFATTVRVRNVTKTGFEMKLQKETAVKTALSSETVSFFAIAPGSGLMDGRKIIVGKTANNLISPTLYKTIQFGDSIANPIFISQFQTCNDDTVTATLRCLTLSAKFANVIKQRERSTTASYALTEGAGWMVIDPVSIIQGVKNPEEIEMSIYPNPVTDYLYIKRSNTEQMNVEVYNLYGVLVKRIVLDKNKVNVSDLSSGCYILKAQNMKSAKFVKL